MKLRLNPQDHFQTLATESEVSVSDQHIPGSNVCQVDSCVFHLLEVESFGHVSSRQVDADE